MIRLKNIRFLFIIIEYIDVFISTLAFQLNNYFLSIQYQFIFDSLIEPHNTE